MNLYDVLAGQGTTHFERLFSQRFAGGAVQTLTGQPPLSFKADGTPLISWSMKGNGSQSGTPTPDNPVMPEFVGVRTGNLVEGYIPNCNTNASGGLIGNPDFNMFYARVEQGKTYCADVSLLGGYFATIPEIGKASYDGQRLAFVQSPFTAPITGYLAFRKTSNYTAAMVNEGQTLQNYEPYGYKIPITCAGQTVPVYLGQTQTVRKIRKLVLDGTESNWIQQSASGGNVRFRLPVSNAVQADTAHVTSFCTHLALGAEGSTWSNNLVYTITLSYLYLRIDDYQTLADFKAFLAAQYAAGNPVTVWYVLAEPTTGIVNEPLTKIGDYADELHSEDAGVTIPTARGSNTLTVGTELQPSSMTITFK